MKAHIDKIDKIIRDGNKKNIDRFTKNRKKQKKMIP